jgi:hypothetical protein
MHGPEVLLPAVFTLSLSEQKPLPIVLQVRWAPAIAAKIREVRNRGAYKEKVSLGEGVTEKTIVEMSKSQPLLDDILYDLRCRNPQSAADFLLQWAQCAGLLLSTSVEVRRLLGIVHVFCQHVANDIRITNPEAALVGKFLAVDESLAKLLCG